MQLAPLEPQADFGELAQVRNVPLDAAAIAVDGAGYLANGASFTELDKLSDADWERMRAMIKAQNDKDRAGRSA